MPHCTATFKRLVMRIADDLAGGADRSSPVAARSNSPRVEPVPWPMTGASAKNRSDFCQNSSRSPIDVGTFSVL